MSTIFQHGGELGTLRRTCIRSQRGQPTSLRWYQSTYRHPRCLPSNHSQLLPGMHKRQHPTSRLPKQKMSTFLPRLRTGRSTIIPCRAMAMSRTGTTNTPRKAIATFMYGGQLFLLGEMLLQKRRRNILPRRPLQVRQYAMVPAGPNIAKRKPLNDTAEQLHLLLPHMLAHTNGLKQCTACPHRLSAHPHLEDEAGLVKSSTCSPESPTS